MPEQDMDELFEQRLARRLRDFTDEAAQPINAAEIARTAAAGKPARPRALFPAWTRPLAYAALLVLALAALGIAGGFIRLPTNDLAPNPSFQPFSPLPGSPPPGSLLPTGGPLPSGEAPPTLAPGSFAPTLAPASEAPATPSSTAATTTPAPTDAATLEPTIAPSPSPVAPAPPVVAVEAGDLHACAVTTDGRIFCWGDNDQGALGDGTATTRFTADVPVVGINDAVAISSGIRFSCAIRGTGTVWCWGEDPGSDSSTSFPVQVPQLDDATALAAGGAFACALRQGGSVACWGNGQVGQLGNGVFENNSGVPTPQAVIGIDDAVAISAGWGHACALSSNGTIWCWGANGDGATAYGQLGDGTFEQRRATPAPVVGIDDAIAVEAGGWSTCAIRVDRSVWCWGYGERGTLGDGNATNSATPVRVSELDDAETVALGGWHACVSRNDRSVWCWGDIAWGGVGGDKTTPVEGRRLIDAATLTTERNLIVLDRQGGLWQWGFGSSNVPEQMIVGP